MASSLESEKKVELKNVGIPRTLYEEVERKISGTSYKSVSDYVTTVLRQFLGKSEEEASGKPALSSEDEEEIKNKLKALGYL